MKIGTQVKVVACLAGHEFEIGEVVTRAWGVYDSHRSVAFESELNGVWYMTPDEYELITDTIKDQPQYIVTIEHWTDGKAESWEQCTLELSPDTTASGLYNSLKQSFGKEGYNLRVVDLFKL